MTDPHTQGGPIEVATVPGDITDSEWARLRLFDRIADAAIAAGVPAVFAGLNEYREPIVCTTYRCHAPSAGQVVAFPDVARVQLVANGDDLDGYYAHPRPGGRTAYFVDVPADGEL
jgi:hypothetical protein